MTWHHLNKKRARRLARLRQFLRRNPGTGPHTGVRLIFWSCLLDWKSTRQKTLHFVKNTLSTSPVLPAKFATMATIKIIKEAIGALKERTGSSVIAINKWIESEKKVSAQKLSRVFLVSATRVIFLVQAMVALKSMWSAFFQMKPLQPPHIHSDRWSCAMSCVFIGVLFFNGRLWLAVACLRRSLYNFVGGNCDGSFWPRPSIPMLQTHALSPSHHRPPSRSMSWRQPSRRVWKTALLSK